MMCASDRLPNSNAQWVVLFDAVGTLIYPHRPAAQTYFEFGREFGSRLKLSDVQSRFLTTRQSVFAADDINFAGGLSSPSSNEIEKQLWFNLVQQVFVDVQDIKGLFDSLWGYYSQPEHWMVYSDVPDCLVAMFQTGARMGLASNFDSRLSAIAASILDLRRLRWIFYSAKVGYRKPDPRFFTNIESRICTEFESGVTPRFLMVGDHYINDVLAPARLGWSSIHIDRSQTMSHGNVISTLRELDKAFSLITDSRR